MQSHNRTIIESVYLRKRTVIINIFTHAGICLNDAEDMSQDVFLRMMNVGIIIPETADAMAIKIAYNMRTDYFRTKHFSKVTTDAAICKMDEYNDSTTLAICNNINKIEDKAITKLSKIVSRVYCMNRYEEMNSVEISQVMGISKKTVETHIYNARRIVRDYISKAL